METEAASGKPTRSEAKKARLARHQQRQKEQQQAGTNSYTSTCNILPCDFPLQANGKVKEPEVLKRWQTDALYQQCQLKNLDKPKFILHDGPPYANGPIHVGHALNKVLKDVTTKSRRMSGYCCPFVPGWDCHGLPIELKVTEKHGLEKDQRQIDRQQLRALCRDYADSWINAQAEDFKRLGVIADWENRYTTMDPRYAATVLRVFGKFVEDGYVERKEKTVPWCPSCQTVLANAEIEYQTRLDPSCYIAFPLTTAYRDMVLTRVKGVQVRADAEVGFLVWTTTPWTLPLNRALVLNPDANYVLVYMRWDVDEQQASSDAGHPSTEQPELLKMFKRSYLEGKNSSVLVLVGEELAEKLATSFKCAEYRVLASFPAVFFERNEFKARHPMIDELEVPVLLDDMVLLKEKKEKEEHAADPSDSNTLEGEPERQTSDKHEQLQRTAASLKALGFQERSQPTGVVHLAPGCGPEDYAIGVKYRLDIYSPVGEDGRYTSGIRPASACGLKVTSEGQQWALQELYAKGSLLQLGYISHSYPHCWRCHNGLIFRATKQWFFTLNKNETFARFLIAKAVKEVEEKVEFVEGAKGKERFLSFLGTRSEWCCSRQRHWGIPIPALHCKQCRHAQLDQKVVAAVSAGVEKHGIDYWEQAPLAQVLQGIAFSCSSCGNQDPSAFDKERDILDVWFDSGVSSYAVLTSSALDPHKEFNDPDLVADLYLEGSDQHRGWFQSSMFCSLVATDRTCSKAFLTHGFVVDKDGRKMSKSAGNGLSPLEIIGQYNADVLRMWVCSADYTGDVVLSQELLKAIADDYRKLRSTMRFLLQNLVDFDATKHAVELHEMLGTDQYILASLRSVYLQVRQAYASYNYASAFSSLVLFCRQRLSRFYFEAAKRRLYFLAPDCLERRSSQTALAEILDVLTRLLAPITSFLAEEVSDHYQKPKECSIHLQDFREPRDVWNTLSTLSSPSQPQPQPLPPHKFKCMWGALKKARAIVNKSLEEARQQCIVKSSLEARLTLHLKAPHPLDESALSADPTLRSNMATALWLLVQRERARAAGLDYEVLSEYFVVSECDLEVQSGEAEDGVEGKSVGGGGKQDGWLAVTVERMPGAKCPRCWRYTRTTQTDNLCDSCAKRVAPSSG